MTPWHSHDMTTTLAQLENGENEVGICKLLEKLCVLYPHELRTPLLSAEVELKDSSLKLLLKLSLEYLNISTLLAK